MGYDRRLCADVLAVFIGAMRRSLRRAPICASSTERNPSSGLARLHGGSSPAHANARSLVPRPSPLELKFAA